jgi:hypothetical protein
VIAYLCIINTNQCAEQVRDRSVTRHSIKNFVDDVYQKTLENLVTGIASDNVSLVQAAYRQDIPLDKLYVNRKIVMPLISAAYYDSINVIHFLIAAGVDINQKDINGNTALQIACDKGYTNIVRLLLDSSAQVNVSNNNGCSPLVSALKQGSLEIVKLLVSSGANINSSDTDGLSLCMIAAQRGYTATIEYLYKAGACINTQDKAGNTALIHVLEFGHLTTAQTLINECNADYRILNNKGQTALSIAQKICTDNSNYELLHLMFVKLLTVQQKESFKEYLKEMFHDHADKEEIIVKICPDSIWANDNSSYFSTLTNIVKNFISILLIQMPSYYRNTNTVSFNRISYCIGLILASSSAYVVYKKILHTYVQPSLF